MGDRLGHDEPVVPRRHEFGEREPAKGSLVDEAQFTPVGQLEPGVHVCGRGRVRLLDEELPAHPEVDDERVRIVGSVQLEPQILAATTRRDDLGAADTGREIGRAGHMAAGDPRPGQRHVLDRPAHDVVDQAAPDDLDLRQFRHDSGGVGGRIDSAADLRRCAIARR